MRIAFLCKRRYMNKDVILDRYARLYEIPFQLAKLGHTVGGFCLSYQGRDRIEESHEALPGQLQWESRPLGKLLLPGLLSYPHTLLHRLRDFAPDLLIGASDIPHVVMSAWLSRQLKVPYAVDLYDNFEGFGQARIPGMIPALRKAVRAASLVTTTSAPLKEFVATVYHARGQIVSMPSTIDKSIFRPMDRMTCRASLGLPANVSLIGTAGGLYRDKGVEALYEAWKIVKERRSDVHLVLAGPVDTNLPPPSDGRIHYLGSLPHIRTAELFNALDVGAICIRDTPFGRYCFPQKAYEMFACGLPVAAACVGVMPDLLAQAPSCLYQVDNPESLASVLLAQLESPIAADVSIDDWEKLIKSVEPKLIELVHH